MTFAHHQTGALNADFVDGEQAWIKVIRYAADDEIVARSQQFPRQHVAALHLNIDFNAGIGVHGPSYGGNHEADGGRGHRADENGSAAAGLHLIEFATRLTQLQQYGARPSRQRLAELRQNHTARCSLTERRFDDRFHFREHARGRRLRHVHGGGSRADLPVLLDHDQHAQVAHLQSGPQQRVVFKDKKGIRCLRLLIHFLVAHSRFYTPHRFLYRFNIS